MPPADGTDRLPCAWAAAAALLLVLGGTAGWLLLSRSGEDAPASGATLSAELDLRKYGVMRGDAKQAEVVPVSLPRGRLNLPLLLPVGSEPGEYEIQILDSTLGSRASTTGKAEIRDFVTRLDATLDVGALPPGNYELALRRREEDLRMDPC